MITIQLDKADRHIKHLMLLHPERIRCRLDALAFLFFRSFPEYHWDAQGCLAPNEPLTPCETMDASSIERKIAYFSEKLSHPGERDNRELLHALIAREELKLIQRAHRQQHIDLYAKYDLLGQTSHFPLSAIQCLRIEHTLLGSIPFDTLDPDWAFAAHEAVVLAMSTMHRHFAMGDDALDIDKVDPIWSERADGLLTLARQLHPLIDKEAG